MYYEKNRDELFYLQNDYRKKRNTEYKELLKTYVELKNKVKSLEEKVTKIDSESNQTFR